MKTHMPRLATLIPTLALASLASAAPPSLDFDVEDDASYLTFREAITAAEYVRYDYVRNQRPRVVAATAALVAFATRNPLADETQLAAFIERYDQALALAAPGDPDLERSSNLIAAARFTRVADPLLAGTTTDIGADVLELLDLTVPPPEGFESMRQRMVAYDRARTRALANAKEWATVLVIGFSGQDAAGRENVSLAPVLRAYLESQGLEPIPDGIDDGRFVPIDAALAAAFPPDHAAFAAAVAAPIEINPLWSSVTTAFTSVATATDARLAELSDAMLTEPDLVLGAANAADPGVAAQIMNDYESRIDEVADERVLIDVNALLLLQSDDPDVRLLAANSRDLGASQLETNNTIAGITSGIEYAAGLGGFLGGIASGNPATAISGLASIVNANISLVSIIQGTDTPSADQQMFDQIIEMREQLAEMQAQMHERFDRVEEQLNVIYVAMADGFNALQDDIEDLSEDVDDLAREMAVARASLERIEDALWGIAEDVLLLNLTLLANDVLDYRDDNGVDLPYATANPNFVSGASDLFSWATTIARNDTFAGDQISTLTIANAADRLAGPSIGRVVNDLRTYPASIGEAALLGVRIPAPAPWSQAAAAYAQLARESPWYFAYMRSGDDPNTDLEAIIEAGEDLADAAANARSQQLFDALFAQHASAIDDLAAYIFDVIRPSALTDAGYPPLDPWAGPEQPARQYATSFASFVGQGMQNLPLTPGIGEDCWDIFAGDTLPEITAVIFSIDAASYSQEVQMRATHNGFFSDSDLELIFTYVGSGDGETRRIQRRVVCELSTEFGDPVFLFSEDAAAGLLEQDPILWSFVRHHLLSGDNLQGQQVQAVNQLGENIILNVLVDSNSESASPSTPYVLSQLAPLQDAVWNAAIAEDDLDSEAAPIFGAVALIDAYVTLALPDLLEDSAIARAALRANPLTGELALNRPLDLALASRLGAGDDGEFDLAGALAPSIGLLEQEIMLAIGTPATGHSYIHWTLAELADLRDGTFRLAIDDTYTTNTGVTLNIPADAGLLVNDTMQPFLTTVVDISHDHTVGCPSPTQGEILINPDGSFTYTPPPGFVGDDCFTYRTTTEIIPGSAATADPAIVVIRVTESNACSPADLAEPFGMLDFTDMLAFLGAFGAGQPVADLAEPFGTLDFTDVLAFLTAFGAGCP